MRHSIRSATQNDHNDIIELFRQTEKLHVSKGPDFFAVATAEDVNKVFDTALYESLGFKPMTLELGKDLKA